MLDLARIAAIIPANAVPVRIPGCADTVAVAYTYLRERDNRYAFIVFVGKAKKHTAHFLARSAEHARSECIRYLLAAVRSGEEEEARKADKRAAVAALDAATLYPVGSFIVNTWGYEQTNADFFKVVGHKGKLTLLIGAVAAKSVMSNEARMTGSSKPDEDDTPRESVEHRVTPYGVRFEHGHGKKWDGLPVHISRYG